MLITEPTIIKAESLNGEIWKPIVGYEGYYDVSNFGRVKRLSGKVPSKSHKHGFYFLNKERIIKQAIGTTGCYSFIPCINSVPQNMKVHRAVAMAFIPNTDNKPFVNHKDGNRLNNKLENLEWVTRSENTNHSLYILGKNIGEGNGSAKLNKKQVAEIKYLYNNRIKLGLTLFLIAERYNISFSNVGMIGKNITWMSTAPQKPTE